MRLMKLRDWLSAERGRTKQLADALQVSGSIVTQWASGKPVSAERCVPIETVTGHAVRRWDLRPDDWHGVWPELVGVPGAPPVTQQEHAA